MGTEQTSALCKAMVEVQGELTNPPLGAVNPHFKSKYTSLNELQNHIRPILHKYGLAIELIPVGTEWGAGIKPKINHDSGESVMYEPFILPVDKKTAQAYGSAITYARRYVLCSLLGIAGEEDDDGNGATEARVKGQAEYPKKEFKPATETQKSKWIKAAEGDKDLIQEILIENGYEGKSSNVPTSEAQSILALIEMKVAAMNIDVPF